jgi:hypothetical protein
MPSQKRPRATPPTEPPRAPERAPSDARDERVPTPPAYQEGNVESIGGGPSGTDTDDRGAERGSAPSVPRATGTGANRDVFISGEVAEESADATDRPERTRS